MQAQHQAWCQGTDDMAPRFAHYGPGCALQLVTIYFHVLPATLRGKHLLLKKMFVLPAKMLQPPKRAKPRSGG